VSFLPHYHLVELEIFAHVKMSMVIFSKSLYKSSQLSSAVFIQHSF
jgi:hypothetical protein